MAAPLYSVLGAGTVPPATVPPVVNAPQYEL